MPDESSQEMGKHPDEYWTDDDRLIFSSVYARFTAAFHAQGGQELEVSSAEAFLSFLHLYLSLIHISEPTRPY